MPNTLAHNLRSARLSIGLSQAAMAEKLNMAGKGTISNWETGKSEPNIDNLIKIAELTGKSLDWLIVGERIETKLNRTSNITTSEFRVEATIAAGHAELYDRTDNYEFKALDYSPRENYFWLQVDKKIGESMKPFLLEGEYLLCGVKEKVRSGDIVAAKWGKNNAAVKIYNETDTGEVILSSYNPLTPFIFLRKKEVILFKVILIEKIR